ncbi:hypothetical protein [Mangrovibacter phragmitis]|uniref:hypothetical protein n=1 Tax=Mangrovibacter phragmitis TaxID=1691903 RepID=UPI00336A0F72
MKTLKRILLYIVVFIVVKVFFHIINYSNRIQIEQDIKSNNYNVIQTPKDQEISGSDKPDTTLSPASTKPTTVNDVPRPGYYRYIVGNGISVELPESWSLLTHDQIMGIKKKSGTSNEAPSNTTIAANSSQYANRNEGVFRASFTGESLKAEDLKAVSRADLDALCQSMNDILVKNMAKQGVSLTRKAYCSITTISNKNALLISYQRTDLNAHGLWDVFIYQVPVNGQAVMFTTSYKKNASPQVQTQIIDILHSIRWN